MLILLAYSGTVHSTMLMIRFQRIGRKNDPAFRIVVLEKTSGPKAGKYVELVGSYNPKTKDTNLKEDRIKEWADKGAQISPSLMNLLISKGVYTGTKSAVVSKKNLEKNKAKNEEAAAKAAADAQAKIDAEKAAAAAPVVEEAAVEEEVAVEAAAMPSEEAIEAEIATDEPVEVPVEEVAAEEAAA